MKRKSGLTRRDFIRTGLVAGVGAMVGPYPGRQGFAASRDRLMIYNSSVTDTLNPYDHSSSPIYGMWQHIMEPLIEYGASPRATIYLAVASRAHAYLRGRGYVLPEDVKAIGVDVLRHRVITSYEAEAEDVTADDIVARIFESVDVP